jgi:hypothetical protein
MSSSETDQVKALLGEIQNAKTALDTMKGALVGLQKTSRSSIVTRVKELIEELNAPDHARVFPDGNSSYDNLKMNLQSYLQQAESQEAMQVLMANQSILS